MRLRSTPDPSPRSPHNALKSGVAGPQIRAVFGMTHSKLESACGLPDDAFFDLESSRRSDNAFLVRSSRLLSQQIFLHKHRDGVELKVLVLFLLEAVAFVFSE